MVDVRWEDPPRSRINWEALMARLQEQPGRWARLIAPMSEAKANHYYRYARKHGAEAVIRAVDGQGYGVWARWPEDS